MPFPAFAAPASAAPVGLPANAGSPGNIVNAAAMRAESRLIPLPRMPDDQIGDLISDIALELEMRMGYRRVQDDQKMFPLPDRAVSPFMVSRKTAGKTDYIRMGYLTIPRRGPQLVVSGGSMANGVLGPNADIGTAEFEPLVRRVMEETFRVRSKLSLSGLQANLINLSYIDADSALFALRAMGYSAVMEELPLADDDSFRGRDVPLLKGSRFSEPGFGTTINPSQTVTLAGPDGEWVPGIAAGAGAGLPLAGGLPAASGMMPLPGFPAAPGNLAPRGLPRTSASSDDSDLPGGSSMPPMGSSSSAGSMAPMGGTGSLIPLPPMGGATGGLGGAFNGGLGSNLGSNLGGSLGGSMGGGLGGMGSPTPAKPAMAKVPSSIDYDRLPLIFKMPTPDPRNVGLVGSAPKEGDSSFGGSASAAANSLGVSMIPSAATPLAPTVSSSTTQLLVLTHPDSPEQFHKVKRVLEDLIDKPARQVFVEGLVLEVSKQAIEELGIQWNLRNATAAVQLGTLVQLTPNAGQTALDILKNSAASDASQFIARINALVDRNKAEILSRPSVLTLDNRQATIRVGTDIPIATSKDASSGAASGRVAFSFQYLPTGILLNVRPRINQEGREISMLIDATVSATVPGQDLRVIDPTTNVTLASAPSISTRRVQTYARIPNNTPLIIGGLVSRDQTKQEDKVPGLGDIPYLGRLFGYESNKDARREVIIVLTPSIVTEEFRATKPQLPKDDDRFDMADMTLFREAYRIRAEDLIDSQFIRFNRRLLTYRSIANQVMARNPALEKSETFARFQGTKVPGEFIFVSGMMARMLSRLKAGENVNIDKLMFFEGTEGAQFSRESVGGIMRRLGDGKTAESFFKKNPNKALTLRFSFARASTRTGQWATEPLAEVKVVDCADRQTWKQLLWDMNQPVDGDQKHYTIVIHDESDLERLKTAVALKNTILNNGNERGTVFDNFLPGRMVSMQQVSPDWERTMEGTIGRYFYFSELFYPAFADTLERSIRELDVALRLPEMAKYLNGINLPSNAP
ncbi:type II secretion system protein GspD [Lacisediminimonas sp.]|uniref:type II secretion system protein GspD n=1 Tax=Lacisediminimonas sp. TaxID=3060582 RepID=UPI002719C610|nr:hypothetical protein [Lacisediminimonas sp.]MDO8300705.1 hypothetical protein [Lacisediminimonas sp.]